MPQHGREAAGTLAGALVWAVVGFLFFIGLGFATHALVEMTIKKDEQAWRAAVRAVAAMFLLTATVIVVLVAIREISLVGRHSRQRRAVRVADGSHVAVAAPPPADGAPVAVAPPPPAPAPAVADVEPPAPLRDEPTQEVAIVVDDEDPTEPNHRVGS